MMALTPTVTRDATQDALVVALTGELGISTAPVARQSLLKCYAECPAAVVVDLTDVRVDHQATLTVFPATQRYAEQGAYVALLLCGLDPDLAGSAALGSDISLHSTRTAALTAARRGTLGPHHQRLHLAPLPGAPALARAFVAETCAAWDLDDLAGEAKLIASELVTNAVRHAGTDLEVVLSRRDFYLHLGVRDRSPAAPPQPGSDYGVDKLDGRGLHLVDAVAAGWGCATGASSKVVWATLRLPSGRPRGGVERWFRC
jgi:anti-anti-sigma regulatory factor